MTLDEELKIILEFEKINKGIISYSKTEKKKYTYLSPEHLKNLRNKLDKGRSRVFQNPKTYADNAVYEFLRVKKKYKKNQLKNIIRYHYDAMGAENIIGHYLEEFINENKGDESWIWCSGSILDKIDFIQKIEGEQETTWKALQVKSSSNTENSSSKTVRKDTEILMWYRRNAYKENSQDWSKLQEFISNENLNEKKFLEFLRKKAKN